MSFFPRYQKKSKNSLRIIISTRRLLQIGLKVQCLHADGTYKLNVHGLPVIVVGTTDEHKQFHPLCISVCNNEKAEDY